MATIASDSNLVKQEMQSRHADLGKIMEDRMS